MIRHALLGVVALSFTACSGVFRPQTLTYAVICAGGVNCSESRSIIRDGIDAVSRDTGYDFVEESPAGPPAILGEEYCPNFGKRRTDFWRFWFATVYGQTPDMVIVALPYPSKICKMDWEDVFQHLGMADGIGTIWGARIMEVPALAYVRFIEGKRGMAVQTVTHEVGHLMGATHASSGIMKSSSSQMWGGERFSPWSLFEIWISSRFN